MTATIIAFQERAAGTLNLRVVIGKGPDGTDGELEAALKLGELISDMFKVPRPKVADIPLPTSEGYAVPVFREQETFEKADKAKETTDGRAN